jgi:hypothetical protein
MQHVHSHQGCNCHPPLGLRAKRMASIQALRSQRVPGSFVHHGCGIAFICPCGCGRESYLRRSPVECGPSWDFSGTVDAPTLEPSIYNAGMPCQWHGWLRAGYWQPC